jgi:formylglycine-generating enzyme required for sulfatase activity
MPCIRLFPASSQRVCRGRVFMAATLAMLVAWQIVPTALGQVLTPDGKISPGAAPPQTGQMKNTLGVPFLETPGTPVLIAAWETRVSDFEAFVRESGYEWEFKPHFPQSGDHPVVNVTMRDAVAYCNWLTKREQDGGTINELQSYRLPTGKEWDAAVGLASGRKPTPLALELEEDKQRYPWGMDWPPSPQAGNLNFAEISGKDDGYTFTAPVGRFAPSPEGICDLAGNVWEWTWDRDSQSESVGTLRGGSWMYFRKECLLSGYHYDTPSTLRSPSIGFRCVFEDKRRSAVFLTKAREAEKGKQEDRSTVATAPKMPDEEVQRMREEMRKKSEPRPAAGPVLPDTATLKPAKAGETHMNTLGMVLRPLEGAAPALIGEHEVRVQDYEAGAKALGKPWDRRPTFTFADTHPIMNVTWKDAVQFCEWLTQRERAAGLIGPRDRYRLPTDLEWSRAAGLPDEKGDTPASRHLQDKTQYPWGTQSLPQSRTANLDSARMSGFTDSFSHTAPVKSSPAEKTQLYDLAGNVAEWCEDAWAPGSGERVIRGSSWLTSANQDMLTSSRQHLSETLARPDVGFRVVLELAP